MYGLQSQIERKWIEENGEEALCIIQEIEKKHAEEKATLIKISDDKMQRLTERLEAMEKEHVKAKNTLMNQNDVKTQALTEKLKTIEKERMEEKEALMV